MWQDPGDVHMALRTVAPSLSVAPYSPSSGHWSQVLRYARDGGSPARGSGVLDKAMHMMKSG
jgi:hypothetical protein